MTSYVASTRGDALRVRVVDPASLSGTYTILTVFGNAWIFTTTTNGLPVALEAGLDFTYSLSDVTITAVNLATRINADPVLGLRVSAVAAGAAVTVSPKTGTTTLSLAVTAGTAPGFATAVNSGGIVDVDVEQLALVGTVRGVVPLAAAARCGPGVGSLSFSDAPRSLSFRAPGSSSYGIATEIPNDGDYLVEDGDDSSRWLRVRVLTNWLPDSPAQASVFLGDRFNEIGGDDVPASEAAAGGVDVFQLDLVNMSTNRVDNVRAWLDPQTHGLAISTDGATWKTPTSEGDPNVLSWASIDAAASVTLYVRRTIGAGLSPSASILNVIQLAWDGL